MTTLFYFICDWGKTPKAWLSTNCPDDYYHIGKVKWRGQPVTIEIKSVQKISLDSTKEYMPQGLYPLLKSNLQKQVRRQKKYAIATTARLWELNKFELLRRLSIIAAEDSELSIETAVVVWLMVAKSKNVVLNDDHKSWILGYVSSLVEHPTCRRLEIGREAQCNENLQVINVMNGNHPKKNTIAAILLRTAYGGLKGDPPMLSRCLDYLLINNMEIPTLRVYRYNSPMPRLLINKAAVDHHIWHYLVEQLVALHPSYDHNSICTVIWECSSGINNRIQRYSTPEWIDCWKEINSDFRKLTKNYIAKILKQYPRL